MSDSTKKVLRVLFILTFLPYALILIAGLIAAIAGFGFMNHYEQGFEAFCSIAGALTTIMIFVPIIPICFAIQITTLVNKIRKIDIEDVDIKRFIISVLTLTAAFLLLIFGGSFLSGVISAKLQSNKINKQFKKSEEVIVYNEAFTQTHKIAGETYSGDVLLIDWDSNEVAFVYSYTTSEILTTYELELMDEANLENIINSNNYIDRTYKFSNGNTFSIYSTSGTGANLLSIKTASGETYAYVLESNRYMNLNPDIVNENS